MSTYIFSLTIFFIIIISFIRLFNWLGNKQKSIVSCEPMNIKWNEIVQLIRKRCWKQKSYKKYFVSLKIFVEFDKEKLRKEEYGKPHQFEMNNSTVIKSVGKKEDIPKYSKTLYLNQFFNVFYSLQVFHQRKLQVSFKEKDINDTILNDNEWMTELVSFDEGVWCVTFPLLSEEALL